MLSAWILLACAVLGVLDALYFVAVTYRWMAPDARLVPRVCRMDEATCARVVDTPWARVFGLPNAVYGLAWYVIMAGVAVWALTGNAVPACLPLLIASAGTVAFSALLFWSLVWRLRTPCPLCFLGHGLNAAIFGILLWLCR